MNTKLQLNCRFLTVWHIVAKTTCRISPVRRLSQPLTLMLFQSKSRMAVGAASMTYLVNLKTVISTLMNSQYQVVVLYLLLEELLSLNLKKRRKKRQKKILMRTDLSTRVSLSLKMQKVSVSLTTSSPLARNSEGAPFVKSSALQDIMRTRMRLFHTRWKSSRLTLWIKLWPTHRHRI